MTQRSSDDTILRRSAPDTAKSGRTTDFLDNGGEMGGLMRNHDWSDSQLGPVEQWPACLQTAVSIMLTSASPAFIWWGREQLTNMYNDAYRPILGDRHPHSLGRPAEAIWPEIWSSVGPLARKVFETGIPIHRENMPLELERDGRTETAYFTFSYTPIRSDDPGVAGLFCAVTETTSQVMAERQLDEYEAKLQESERRFRSLADTAPMFIAMADDTGNATYFNKAWLDFTGKRLSEMTGLQWLNVLHPEDAPKFEHDFKQAFTHQATISQEYRFRRADGEYRWMLAVGAPRFTPDGRFVGYFGTYTDFHDLKQAQLKVQDSEERLRTMANNIAQLTWMAEPDGKRTWFNQRWYDYSGLTEHDAKDWGWKQIHHPEHLERVLTGYRHAVKAGQPWEDTFPLRGRDGTYRWFLVRAVPIRDADGRISRWFGTNTDITDLRDARRRKDELEHVTNALKEQQAQLVALNQAKDEFISLASHQLRTPATGVKQYLGMLLGDFAGELTSDQRELAQHAYDSNERQLSVITDLLSVAQADAGKISLHKRETDLVRLIEGILDEQAGKFADRHQTITFRHRDAACPASVDTGRMRMVLENLVDNASKYTPEGLPITVGLARLADGSVRVRVRDQGVGISADNLDTIFDKFIRVDNPLSTIVGGSGLGLYLARKIVELHSGTITVTSTPGKGSVFSVTLPVE
jgi:PAS domain S-box-containing protein